MKKYLVRVVDAVLILFGYTPEAFVRRAYTWERRLDGGDWYKVDVPGLDYARFDCGVTMPSSNLYYSLKRELAYLKWRFERIVSDTKCRLRGKPTYAQRDDIAKIAILTASINQTLGNRLKELHEEELNARKT